VFLQRFISYIVDLTIVLQTLYLVLDGRQELSRTAIKLTFKAYHGSPTKGEVHAQIQEYVGQLTMLDRIMDQHIF
jgi:hypothetical protein